METLFYKSKFRKIHVKKINIYKMIGLAQIAAIYKNLIKWEFFMDKKMIILMTFKIFYYIIKIIKKGINNYIRFLSVRKFYQYTSFIKIMNKFGVTGGFDELLNIINVKKKLIIVKCIYSNNFFPIFNFLKV